MRSWRFMLCIGALGLGCQSPDAVQRGDARVVDTGLGPDAHAPGPDTQSGRPDAGRPDSTEADAARPDAARPDAARPDAPAIDAGPGDASPSPPDARAAERGPGHPLPAPPEGMPPPTWSVSVIERIPHDPRAFTQGLAIVDGVLYESTGLNGQSSVRIVDPATGEVRLRRDLADRYFGEGLAPVGDALIQLTWRSQVAFVYDRATLEPRGEHAYAGQGWGLTYDGERLILSDGSDRLRFFDPLTFEETGSVAVRDAGRPVDRLNELEYIDGEVLANVWQTDLIVRIDPATGRVIGRLDLAGLRPAEADARDDVLNGIAWDRDGRRLLVTGKRWPLMFSIRALPPDGP